MADNMVTIEVGGLQFKLSTATLESALAAYADSCMEMVRDVHEEIDGDTFVRVAETVRDCRAIVQACIDEDTSAQLV